LELGFESGGVRFKEKVELDLKGRWSSVSKVAGVRFRG